MGFNEREIYVNDTDKISFLCYYSWSGKNVKSFQKSTQQLRRADALMLFVFCCFNTIYIRCLWNNRSEIVFSSIENLIYRTWAACLNGNAPYAMNSFVNWQMLLQLPFALFVVVTLIIGYFYCCWWFSCCCCKLAYALYEYSYLVVWLWLFSLPPTNDLIHFRTQVHHLPRKHYLALVCVVKTWTNHIQYARIK